MAEHRGPAELVLTVAVAQRYYLESQSKVQIADALGISRFKVARLIEQARSDGLVRIEIVQSGPVDVALSTRLQDAYGLRHAVVVRSSGGDAIAVRRQLGSAAADLLVEILTDRDVLGLPWARGVAAMVDSLTALPHVPVVQLTGALTRPDEDSSSVDLVRRVARLAGGESHVFYAPMLFEDAAGARALRRQPPVADAMAHVTRVTKAFVGVGRWAAGQSTIHDELSPVHQRRLADAGVVGEIAGVLFDSVGEPVRSPVTARLITVQHAQLRLIDEVVGMAAGAAKAPSVRAAIQGGLLEGLVVDGLLAEALLDGR